MVSSAVFLAACIVPPVCVLVVVLWTIGVYWRIQDAVRSPVAVPAPSSSHTVERHTAHPVFAPSPHFLPRLDIDGTLPLVASPSVISRDALYATLPPAPQPPPEARFSIRTTPTQSGSRVLARPLTTDRTSSAGHDGATVAELGGEAPAKTRRDTRRFGVGDADDARAWEVVGAVRDQEILTPRSRGLRRRSSTWSAQDWERLVPPTLAHASPRHDPHHGTLYSPSSPLVRAGRRPLPPGAGWSMLTTSEDGRAPSTSGTSAEAGPTLESSQESEAPLLLRYKPARSSELLEREQHGQEGDILVRPLREHGRRSLQHHQGLGADASAAASEHVEALSEESAGARLPTADSRVSAASSAYFGTTMVALPPGTPSGSSSGDEPPRQSAWSDSTYEAGLTDFPIRSVPARPPRGLSGWPYPPAPTAALQPQLGEPSPRTSRGSPAALKELEAYAASLRSALAPPPPEYPSRASTLPSRPLSHSRRQDSAPWFAAPKSHPPARADPGEQLAHLDAEREREAILVARRPISWLARQPSSGSLPDGVPGFGNLAILNPDAESCRSSTASPGLAG